MTTVDLQERTCLWWAGNFLFKSMPKTRSQKEEQLRDITERLSQAQGIVFAADSGLTVSETEELRGKLRAEGAAIQVVKKTLLKKALAEAKIESDMDGAGNISMAYSESDAVAPARLVNEVAKGNEKFAILGGVLEGGFIPTDKVVALAKLPSREELLAKVVGSINAPVSGFVNVLAGNLRGFVNVLNAIKDTKSN